MIEKLGEVTERMIVLENDIENIQNILISNRIDSESRGMLSKELEFKLTLFTLCGNRLKDITELIDNTNA